MNNLGALFEGLPKWFRMAVVLILVGAIVFNMFVFTKSQQTTVKLLQDIKRAEMLNKIYNKDLPIPARAEACDIYVYEMGQNGTNKHYCEVNVWGSTND